MILPQIGNRDDQRRRGRPCGHVRPDVRPEPRHRHAEDRTTSCSTRAGTYKVLDSISPQNLIKHPITGQNFQVKFGPAQQRLPDR